MPRVWLSSSGSIGISKYIGGCFVILASWALVILGVLGIIALIYSLT